MKEHSPWYFGLCYYNRADARLWVPKRITGMGWTINFGHPSALTAFAWATYGSLGIAVVALSLWRFRLLLPDVNSSLWLIGSMTVAVAVYLLNPLSWDRDAWQARIVSFGLMAAVIGFFIQTLFNGPVVFWLGANNLTWRSHLYLAAVASGAQTLGKYFAIVFALTVMRIVDGKKSLRIALMVGLGFTILEISIIWLSAIVNALPCSSVLGIWERASASLFHIYSAGLIGLFVVTKSKGCLAFILAVHFGMDWCAGSNATLLHLPVVQLEAVFSIAAVSVWVAFLAMYRHGAAP